MTAPILRSADGGWELNGVLLHPAEDPLGAALGEVKNLVASLKAGDVVLQAGSGLGWHAQAILSLAPPGTHLLVYEPDPAKIALMTRHGPRAEGVTLVSEEAELASLLGRHLVYGTAPGVRIFSPRAYRVTEPKLIAHTREIVERTCVRARSDTRTRQLRDAEWTEAFVENLLQSTRFPDLSLAEGIFSGIPALVVGAGPSLDQSLPAMAGTPARCLVLAAASALKPMMAAGIPPHGMVAMEAKDESRQFEGVPCEGILLGAGSRSHPRHFSQWPGQTGLFHTTPWGPALAGLGRAIPTGGHATSVAFTLALLWGCDPIILVGQDLAFTGGRIHAAGRPGGEEEKIPARCPVEGIRGEEAQTSPTMLSYILWYQEAAAFLRTKGRRVINCTHAGALLKGFEHRPLGETLGEIPPLQGDIRDMTRGFSRFPRPGHRVLLQRVLQGLAAIPRLTARLEAQGMASCQRLLQEETPFGPYKGLFLGPDIVSTRALLGAAASLLAGCRARLSREGPPTAPPAPVGGPTQP